MFKGSVASEDLGEVVRALKSAAEPTRLRLLFLLSQAEYTVGELAVVLNQSQPRISRHLRLLTEAGFLDRFREQQCVYYRAPSNGRYLEWQRQLLGMAHPDAQVLKRDRERAVKVVGNRALVAARQLDAARAATDGRGCGPAHRPEAGTEPWQAWPAGSAGWSCRACCWKSSGQLRSASCWISVPDPG